MAAHDLNGASEFAHALFAKVDPTTGAVVVQLGDVISGEVYDEAATVFQQWGLISLPAPADVGKAAAEAHVWKTSGPDIVIGGRDVRTATRAANLKLGEMCVYATTGAARELFKADGSVTQFTTDDNTDNGRSIYNRTARDGFTRFAPWGKETFDNNGYHLLHASGARVDLGGFSAPGLPGALNSYATLSAQAVRIEGALVSLGTQAGTPEPAVKATSLVAYLSGIESILATLAAAIDGKTPSSPGVSTTAVSTALAGIAALKVAMTSMSTQTT